MLPHAAAGQHCKFMFANTPKLRCIVASHHQPMFILIILILIRQCILLASSFIFAALTCESGHLHTPTDTGHDCQLQCPHHSIPCNHTFMFIVPTRLKHPANPMCSHHQEKRRQASLTSTPTITHDPPWQLALCTSELTWAPRMFCFCEVCLNGQQTGTPGPVIVHSSAPPEMGKPYFEANLHMLDIYRRPVARFGRLYMLMQDGSK